MLKTINSRNLGSLAWYPIFFGVYPVLALLGSNINEVVPSVAVRPLLLIILATTIILLLFRALFKDWHRAALVVSLLVFFVFTYGRIYFSIKSVEVFGVFIGRHRYLLPIWILLLAIALWWVVWRVKNPHSFTPTLNFISVFLLIYPLYQTITYVMDETQAERAVIEEKQALIQRADLPLGYAPDIYYIILDAYGREDVLLEMFDYDNSGFIGDLEAMGFYVAQCSQSNYAQSMLSMTSSLNMNYLDNLTRKLNAQTDSRAPLRALGKNNAVRGFLESQGYSTISFATNFPVSEWTTADYFLSPPPVGMNEFEILLADTSVARVAMDYISEPPEKRTGEWYRRRTLFTLEQLEKVVPKIPSPKFVFAHLVIPHHPFVFGPNGEELSEAISNVVSIPDFPIYKQGYSDHVTYINGRIEKIVQMILEQSPNPPIIIIQGDHGPAPFGVNEYRMRNLNAYYFPGGVDVLYETITPVNTFRLVLNEYFGQHYELLDDISYFSAYDIPYNYTIIPNDCGN